MSPLRNATIQARLAGLAALLLFGACARAGLGVGGRDASSLPSLVVVITVDQLSSDYVARFDTTWTAGLRRLLDQGAVWTRGVHDHAITETAPGHASILSGRFPASTGISSNSQGVNTRESPLLGSSDLGASPFRFRGTTLVDWLKAADPSARVLSVSRKDRGAILPVGTSRTDVYWYAPNGIFTTSTYYRDALPPWVQAFNAQNAPAQLAGREWSLLREAARYRMPDTVSREADGHDIVFPHRIPAAPELAARRLPDYPVMDSLTLAFALHGLQALELGNSTRRTDLLSVSLSTTDAVGHRYGPESREIEDHLLRLDRYLGAFLDSLFALRDPGRILIVLTSDHGVAPYPDLRSTYYANGEARRIELRRATSWVRRRMFEDGVDSLAAEYDDGFRIVDANAFRAAGRNPDDYAALWVREVRQLSGVMRADLITDLTKADTLTDVIARRWLHMFRPGDAVRAVVTFTPFSYHAQVDYATHGSPHDYDARVPIVFWGVGISAGLRPGEARVVDIAPTIADHIRVRPQERLDGTVLPLSAP